MVEFNPIKFTKTNQTDTNAQPQVTRQVPNSTPAQQPQEVRFDIDMSAADIQATMNKALGFIRTTPVQPVDYAAVDRKAAKDPAAFVKKHAPEGAYASVDASLTAQIPAFDGQEYSMLEHRAGADLAKLGPEAFVNRFTTPERRAEIEAGLAERNSSPRAFKNEFLDVFSE